MGKNSLGLGCRTTVLLLTDASTTSDQSYYHDAQAPLLAQLGMAGVHIIWDL